MVLPNYIDITLGLIFVYLLARKEVPLLSIGNVSIACGWHKGDGSTTIS